MAEAVKEENICKPAPPIAEEGPDTASPSSKPAMMRKPPAVDDATPSPLANKGRVAHVHKLERKHSSGDLHSRLKTRKLLGVGETDDGDVHRSKLSQILGHSEQLYVRLPRGLKLWHFLLAIMFLVMGIWAVLFPTHLLSFALQGEVGVEVKLPIRLYGAALLGLSVVFWSTMQATDKDVIRWSLLASIVYFSIQILVSVFSLLPVQPGSLGTWVLMATSGLGISGAIYFYLAVCASRPEHGRNKTH